MTEEEYGKRLSSAASFAEEVEATRDFIRSEIAAGHADEASFHRGFGSHFRAPHALKGLLELAKQEVSNVVSEFAVRSCVTAAETLELQEEDRTYVIRVITERPLNEDEEMALPICPHGIPVMHIEAGDFGMWESHAIGGKPRRDRTQVPGLS